jgi:hypothetical protein
MKKNISISKIVGVGALVLMAALNLRHAMNHYGILDNNLALEVLAQSNSGGGSGSGSSGGSGNYGGGSGNGGGSSGGTDKCGATSVTKTYTYLEEGAYEYPYSYTILKTCVEGSSRTCENGTSIYYYSSGATEGGFETVHCPLSI